MRTLMTMRRDHGFTLVELMVSLAIASIILIAITTMFVQYNKLYTLENSRATLQQEMRLAMDIMINDIRMAAVNTNNTEDFKIKTADETRFRFSADIDGNGVLDFAGGSACEVITYRLDPVKDAIYWVCNENMPTNPDKQPILGGEDTEIKVDELTFNYRNKQNQEEDIPSEITGVEITMVARIPAGSAGMQSRTLSAFVTLRNAGPNASKS